MQLLLFWLKPTKFNTVMTTVCVVKARWEQIKYFKKYKWVQCMLQLLCSIGNIQQWQQKGNNQELVTFFSIKSVQKPPSVRHLWLHTIIKSSAPELLVRGPQPVRCLSVSGLLCFCFDYLLLWKGQLTEIGGAKIDFDLQCTGGAARKVLKSCRPLPRLTFQCHFAV